MRIAVAIIVLTYGTPGLSTSTELMEASDRRLEDFGLMLGRMSSPWCGDRATAGLHWNGYGCFCGKGSKGDTPVDEFDAACQGALTNDVSGEVAKI